MLKMLHKLIRFWLLFGLTSTLSGCNIKLIIDTDGVFDDIRALAIALTNPNVEVVAITTVHGGIAANQSAANVARLLRAVGKTSVPIFIGANDSLIPKGPIEVWEELFGYDGIGGVPQAYPATEQSDFTTAQPQAADDAIINLTKTTEDIIIVGLGPLTNIATALQKDPLISRRIRKLVIMGGNYMGIGNTKSYSSAEFNFLMDPEAANIVLSTVPATIIPWDTCYLKAPEYSEEVDYEESLHQNTNLSYFLSNITARGRQHNNATGSIYSFVDDIAVAFAIDHSVATDSLELYASVELEKNASTRAQVIIDWYSAVYDKSIHSYTADKEKNDVNWLSHTFVTDYNANKVNEMLIGAVKANITTI